MFYNRVIFYAFYNLGTLEPPGVPTRAFKILAYIRLIHY